MLKTLSRRSFIASTIAVSACSASDDGLQTRVEGKEKFMCPPCGCSMDHVEFEEPGRCPDCSMVLQPGVEKDLGFEPTYLEPRAGFFKFSGGFGREAKHINVHYYLPDGFDKNSPILLVVPGAGRNSGAYRNAWLDVAKKKKVLVAALGFAEADYDFAAYQLGGVVKNLEFVNPKFEQTGNNARTLNIMDEDVRMDPNPNKGEWIFGDFDRLFKLIVSATGSLRLGYDIFGHSAGGQILHRMALFKPDSLAERIVAGNAGFYTLPDLDALPPYGVDGLGLSGQSLDLAFSSQLTILLGEDDNSDSAGGTLLHTPLIDKQGTGRLSRGKYFYTSAEQLARAREVEFNWQIESVPRVGHDFAAMSEAAARLLYSY